MKKIILLFILSLYIHLSFGQCGAPTEPFYIYFESVENQSVEGSFKIEGKIYFLEEIVSLDFSPVFTTAEADKSKSSFISITGQQFLKKKGTYQVGDSVSFSIDLGYNKTSLPAECLHVQLQMAAMQHNVSTLAFVYFTPYGSVEIWNEDDFEALPRRWNYHIQNRITLNKSDIPITDLTPQELADETVPKSWFSVPGLAYSIPRHAITDTYDKPTVLNGKKADGCGTGRRRWQGTIEGHIESGTINGVIDISGLRVEVWERDGWPNPDDHLATFYTDNNGNFGGMVDVCQKSSGSWSENNDLQIYFVLKSENEEGTVKVKRRIGTVRDIESGNFQWWYNNGSIIIPNLTNNWALTWDEGTDLKPHLLHWGHQARIFINNEHAGTGFSLPAGNDPLVIKRSTSSTAGFFFPKGWWTYAGGLFSPLWYLTLLSSHDAIFLPQDNDLDKLENFFYHEFSHYAMWHLQNESWANPISASFASHGDPFNGSNEKIAWNEGWATGLGSIIDHALNADDRESGRDGNQRFEPRTFGRLHPENIFYDILDIGDEMPTPNLQALTHGYVSEFNIACFIHDLWDGMGNFNTYGVTQSHDDSGNDNLEFSLAAITRPLRENTGIGLFEDEEVISDISEYVRDFRADLNNLNRSYLRDVIALNRFEHLELITNEPNPIYDVPTISTDLIERQVEGTFKVFKRGGDNDPFDFERKNDYNAFFIADIPEITGTEFNLALTEQAGNTFISDRLTIESGGKLGINANWQIGHFGGFPSYTSPSTSTLGVEVCQRQRLDILNNGQIILGDQNARTATVNLTNLSYWNFEQGSQLVINKNSSLIVESGGSLHLADGAKLIMGENSRLVIKPGAYVCFGTGTITNVQSNINIDLMSGYKIGINPSLGVSLIGCVAPPSCITQYPPISLYGYTITDTRSYSGSTITSAGLNVNSGANLQFHASETLLQSSIDVKLGATLTIDNNVCGN